MLESPKLSRRDFLKVAAVAGGAAVLTACSPEKPLPNEPGGIGWDESSGSLWLSTPSLNNEEDIEAWGKQILRNKPSIASRMGINDQEFVDLFSGWIKQMPRQEDNRLIIGPEHILRKLNSYQSDQLAEVKIGDRIYIGGFDLLMASWDALISKNNTLATSIYSDLALMAATLLKK